jgi:alcohol dehydrogenase class IV
VPGATPLRETRAAVFALASSGDVVLPGRLSLGDNAIERLPQLLADLGAASPVLLVADSVLVDIGTAERIAGLLGDGSFDVDVHAQSAGEPDLAVAEAVVAAVRAKPYGAVVGVGGGSAMDPAKLAAGLATNEGPVEDYMRGRAIVRKSLPQVLVPTTSGTGAEASKNTIVTHEGRKFVIGSPLLCSDAAVLDPLLTVSCPPAVTAASGMDALAHAVESTLSTWATSFTLANGLAAVGAIDAWLRTAVEEPENLAARRAMLYAAYHAGLSINASTLLGHSMAYTIATRAHLPHGVATAMSLPYCVAYNARGARDRVALLEAELGDGLAHRIRSLADAVGMPTSLAEVGIPAGEFETMVDEVMTMYPRPNNPVPFERDALIELYRAFHAGDLEAATA